MKVTDFLLLRVVIYLLRLKLNPCVLLLLELLRIFFGRMLFVDMVVLENELLTEGQRIKTQLRSWLEGIGLKEW